jgi:hypothetical protein
MPLTTTDRFNIVVNPTTPAWLEAKLRAAILGTARFYGDIRLPAVDIIIGTNDEWTAEEIALYMYGSRTAHLNLARGWAELCTAPDANDNLSGCALATNEYVNPNDPNGPRWTSYPILIMGYGARLKNYRWHDSTASSTMPHELSHVVQWLSNGTSTNRTTRLAEFNAVEGTCQYAECHVGWPLIDFQRALLEGQSTFFGAAIADIIGQDRYKDPFDQFRSAVSPTVNSDMGHYMYVDYPTSYWQGGDAGYFDPRYYVTGVGTELMVAQFGVHKTLEFQNSLNYRAWFDSSNCPSHPCPGIVAVVSRQATEFQQIFGVSIGTWMTTAREYISRRHAGLYPTLADVGLTMVP